jgi:hypothetical protein
MNARPLLLIALLLVAATTLQGCGCCLGGGENDKQVQSTTNVNTTTTLGQELEDLEKARQSGVLSDAEFEAAKQKLIEQRTGN